MSAKPPHKSLFNWLDGNPLNARMAVGVRRIGFRKWYERELLSGHAHMVLALLCAIAIMAAMEAFKGGAIADKLTDVMIVLVSAVIGIWALRRYLYLLMHAESVANQANCPKCQTYGLFDVLSEDCADNGARVRCRRCAQEWQISDAA
jgi:predicted Zn finger-like uncharacterized protein